MAERYIDLTGTLSPRMWSYRPLVTDIPPFEQRRWATVEEQGFEADQFSMPTLAGTYLETAKHLFPDRPGIAEVPPERLFLPATVARIPKGPREHITVAELEHAAPGLQRGDALLVATGWDRHWWDTGGETFVMESPHYDLPAMQWIVDHGVAMLGGDTPCFDDPQPGGGQDVNLVLFGSDALILAPLVNLGDVRSDRVRLVVLPIKLESACGASCRAVAIEEE